MSSADMLARPLVTRTTTTCICKLNHYISSILHQFPFYEIASSIHKVMPEMLLTSCFHADGWEFTIIYESRERQDLNYIHMRWHFSRAPTNSCRNLLCWQYCHVFTSLNDWKVLDFFHFSNSHPLDSFPVTHNHTQNKMAIKDQSKVLERLY